MKPRAALHAGCGLVQVIRLHWTKAARGGQGSRARQAVPTAFEVPTAQFSGADGNLLINCSHWDESNAFAKDVSVRYHQVSLTEGFTFGCVAVTADAEELRVRYLHDQANGGAPDRWYLNWPGSDGNAGRELTVRDGEWVRVCYNGRFSCMDTGAWWYEQVTVNVAWFAGEPDGCVFFVREPVRELRAMADLW